MLLPAMASEKEDVFMTDAAVPITPPALFLKEPNCMCSHLPCSEKSRVQQSCTMLARVHEGSP